LRPLRAKVHPVTAQGKMLTTFKIQLTQAPLGRVLLHLGCLLRGGHWDFHGAFLRRELAGLI